MGLFSSKDKKGNLKTTMKYISGLPDSYIHNSAVFLVLDEETNNIEFKKTLKQEQCAKLALSKITSYKLINEEVIKEVSGTGRAIAGGLLFGPAGAVVGAITAKDKKKKEYYNCIHYVSNGEEKVIILQDNGNIHSLKFFNRLKEIVKINNPKSESVEL